ncbi:glycosyl hydrolase 53 family protein [Paenibacillus silvae]|uniref:glycosyl hydrolase 53 family protein n=1 Tax=Paenibacillus silvae TaxID=1325358 RepID=UPI0025A0F108|nr:glycosyl hydrolase 53 family protein [Paenibacillus silvae]MDM5277422.1 glycosyl hydrolase 53 family protein [Paenibacillus silvae]
MNTRKRIMSVTLALLLSLTLFNVPAKANSTTAESAPNFAKGADVSWLPQLETLGQKFYDDKGKEKDLLQIIKDHGIDSIRLRAFVNPSDDPSNGHNSTKEVIEMASRVNDFGFRVMIDLHYSDSWADPGKQHTPKAWEGSDLEQLKAHVSEYTTEVMEGLKEASVTPEWIQIGNEINNGMLHPIGTYSNTTNLVELIQSGSYAAKEVFPDIKVIIHRANGADKGVIDFYDGLIEAGLKETDYDIIGLSYYPDSVYTTSIDELSENMNMLAEKFSKEVMIVEIGGNVSKNEDNVYNMLVATQQKLKEVPNNLGSGIFYWAPEGVFFGYPLSAWNSDGTPSLAMDAFLDNAEQVNRQKVTGVKLDKSTTTVEVGDTDRLRATIAPKDATYQGVTYTSSNPDTVKVDRYNGTVSGLAEGKSTITVTAYEGKFTDSAEVVVIPSSNPIENPGFENGLSGWDVTDNHNDAVSTGTDMYSGSSALHYWSAQATEFTVSQKLTGLENGTYELSAWVSGGGEENIAEIFAGEQKQSFTNTGWTQWSNPTIEMIEVTDGTLTIGANLKYSGGQWGNIDDFKLVKQTEAIQTKNLTVNGKTASWYLSGEQPTSFGDSVGSKAFDYGDEQPIDFTLLHEISGLAPGTYTMEAKVFGDKGEPDQGSVMYAVSKGQTYSIPLTYRGSTWEKPATLSLEHVHVDDGVAEVGFIVKTSTNEHFGYLDDITFVRTSDDINRAEFVSLLVRALGVKSSTAVPFRDVKSTQWYAGDVSAAFKAGLVQGHTATRFAPEARITRQELAAILVKAYALKTGNTAPVGSSVSFSDAKLISGWAKDDVAAAVSLGLLEGVTNASFMPQAFVSRTESEQAIAALMKQ